MINNYLTVIIEDMTNRQTVRLDHNIFIPEGVEDLFYTDRYIDDDTEESADSGIGETGFAEDDITDGMDDGLPAPQTFVIVNQIVRTAADGTQVVDVVAETDDIIGVRDVVVRITKE